jgi:hypothetical protein
MYVKAETPPQLASYYNVIYSSALKNICVPTDAAVTAYKKATNWSSYSSKIIKGVYSA